MVPKPTDSPNDFARRKMHESCSVEWRKSPGSGAFAWKLPAEREWGAINLNWPSDSPRFEDVDAETLRQEMPNSLGPRFLRPPSRASLIGNGSAMCASRGEP